MPIQRLLIGILITLTSFAGAFFFCSAAERLIALSTTATIQTPRMQCLVVFSLQAKTSLPCLTA